MGWPVNVVEAGGLPVSEAPDGFGTPIDLAPDGFGYPVTIVESGGLPCAFGEGVGALPAPALSWLSAPEDDTPDFTIDLPVGAAAADDPYVLQLDTTTSFNSGDLNEVEGTVSVEDAGDLGIDLTIPDYLSNVTWYARFIVTGKTSWSNIASETIAAPLHMTSPASFDVDESDTETLVVVLSATRPSTFAIGGTDAADFEIQGGNELHFVDPPDYETPQDADTDNTYDITITPTAIDDLEVGVVQDVAVNVQDIEDTVLTLEGLFAGGAKGALYDFSDLATLFQTEDESTPVTTGGQAIGRVNDKSGNGNHLVQATSGSRLTYNNASSLHFAQSGSDDWIGSAAANVDLSGGPILTIIIGVADNTSGTGSLLHINDGTDTGASAEVEILRAFSSPNPIMRTSVKGNVGTNYRQFVNTQSDGSSYDRYLLSSVIDLSQATAADEVTTRLNAVDMTGTTSGSSNNTNANFGTRAISMFARNAGGLKLQSSRVYAALIINRALTAPEMAFAEAEIAALSGVTI